MRFVAFLFLLLLALGASAQVSTTTIGVDGAGSVNATCTEILRFDNYDDAIAESGSGQNFVFILGSGDSLLFNLKKTGGELSAVIAPSWVGSLFGNQGYTSLSGATVLYQLNNGSTTRLVMDNIRVKNKAGLPVSGYKVIVLDGESTSTYETFEIELAPQSKLSIWDRMTPSASSYGTPPETGIGTNKVVWGPVPTGTTYNKAYSVWADTPTFVAIDLTHASTGYQGATIGIERRIVAKDDTICSGGSVTITPLNASPNSSYAWSAPVITPAGSITGATTGFTPQTLVNATSSLATVQYTITPTACGRVGYPFTVTILVLPNGTSRTLNIPCGDTSAGLVAATPGVWSAVPGNPTATSIVNPNNVTTQVTGLIAQGSYFFIHTSVGGCIDTVEVVAKSAEQFSVLVTPSACQGQQNGSVIVTPLTNASPPYTYTLGNQSAQTNGIFQGLAPGNYLLHISDANNCAFDTSIVLTQPLQYVNVYPADTIVVPGEPVQLSSETAPGVISYQWLPEVGLSCYTCPNPMFSGDTTTVYYLVVSYAGGCTATDTAIIQTVGTPDVFIPNSFTPNGDFLNDGFQIYGYGISAVRLRIFDRWGEKVYDSMGSLLPWDGTYKGELLSPAVFVYVADIDFVNGRSANRKGSITLLR